MQSTIGAYTATRLLAIVGALILVGSLFFDWYRVKVDTSVLLNATGWQAFSGADIALAAGAAVVIALAIGSLATRGRLLSLIGTLGLLVAGGYVIYRIATPPKVGRVSVFDAITGAKVTRSVLAGPFLALAGIVLAIA